LKVLQLKLDGSISMCRLELACLVSQNEQIC